MRSSFWRCVAGASLWAFMSVTQAAEWPSFTARKVDLPVAFRPLDLNDRGDLAGSRQLDSRARWGPEQLGWRRLEGEEVLVVPDLPKGDRHGALLAIEQSGLAAGYGSGAGKADRGRLDHDAPNGSRAMVVLPDGQVQWLELLLDQANSIAFAVNRRQQVLGSVYRWRDELHGYDASPFVWSAEGGTQYPFGLDGDGISMRASAFNDKGQIAGTRSWTPPAWIWDADKGLLVISQDIREVRALNNDGVIVGEGPRRKAIVWQLSKGMRALPPIEGSDVHDCDAADINDAGWIVGVCKRHPTLWIPDADGNYQAADLKELVTPEDRELLSGVKWSEAVKVTNEGRILIHTWKDDPLRFEDAQSASLILTPIPR